MLFRSGTELGLKWSLNHWFINGEYAYIRPKNDKTDQDLPNRSRQNFSLSTGWDNGIYGLSTVMEAKGKSKDLQDIAGHVSLDVNAYWQITPNIKAFSNISNLTDTIYPTAWNNEVKSYYIASGRLASMGVTFRY